MHDLAASIHWYVFVTYEVLTLYYYNYNTVFHSKSVIVVKFYIFAVCQNELRGIDLIFVLDSSGSIGSSNFQLVRNFTANVVTHLDIGPDRNRVGLITFDFFATVRFSLNRYRTNTSLLQAIATVPYNGGGTNTSDGLNTLIAQFSTTLGARPRMDGIPRIAVVVTDGRSNSPSATIAAAKRVHASNILTYAVGVGSNLNMDELNAIATDPDSQYVRLLSAFNVNELRDLQELLSTQACTGE